MERDAARSKALILNEEIEHIADSVRMTAVAPGGRLLAQIVQFCWFCGPCAVLGLIWQDY